MKFDTALPAEYNQKLFKNWQTVLDKNELCSVIAPPISGREYRIQNFLDWQKANKFTTAQNIHLQTELINHAEDVEKLFAQTTQPLIISPAEELLQKEHAHILTAILHEKTKCRKGILLFFETQKSFLEAKNTNLSHKLLQNTDVVPLLSIENTKHFCIHIAKRWQLQLTERQIDTIYSYTGGHMWIIKETLRQLSKKEQLLSKIFSSPEMNSKKKKIWNQLPKQHRQFLTRVVTSKNKTLFENDPIYLDLTSLNILQQDTNQVPEFISELAQKAQVTISIHNKLIYFNDIQVSNFFSKKEQDILHAFLQSPEYRVSRETIAKCLWTTHNDYSDWALDKAISRFRSKLIKLGLPNTALVTLRQQGYQLQITEA